MEAPGAGSGLATGGAPVASPLVRAIAGRPTRHATAVRAVAFFLLTAVTTLGLADHPMWFDELLAWNLARTSDSLGDLTSLLHYGGHPVGWYLPLFAITRVTGDPVWLQVLQGITATATFAVLLFRTPFRLSLQVLVAAGYFFAFEFAVIARPYALCALLFLLAVDALARARPRRVLATSILVVLVFVHQLGAVLAIALVLVELWRATRERRGGAGRLPPDAIGAVVAIAVSVLVMLVMVAPAADAGRRGFLEGGRLADAPLERVGTGISGIARGLLPVPDRVAWDDLVWGHVPLLVTVIASAALWAVVLVALRHDRTAAVLWCIGSAGLVTFFVLAYPPRHVRFSGFFVLLLVAACWYAVREPRTERGRDERPSRVDGLVVGSLGVLVVTHVVVAAVFVVHFLSVPFTVSQEQADAIRDARLENRVVSANDFVAVPIAGYLDRDFRSLAFDEDTRTVVFRDGTVRVIGRTSSDPTSAFTEARAVATCVGAPVALVLGADVRSVPEGARRIAVGTYHVEPDPAATCRP